ncbi:MAG: Hpt domain-containing protein [Planctomycetota bacterium]|nr:Hpt domain-containing protein [Planctomycetota bacterium]
MPDIDVEVFDVEQALRAVDHDRELLCELCELYNEDAGEMLDAVLAAIRTADLDAIARAAHTLKGASATIGAREVTELSKILEEGARTGTLEDAPGVGARLEAATNRLVAALRDWSA